MEDLATFDAGFFTSHREVAFGTKGPKNFEAESDEADEPVGIGLEEYGDEPVEVNEADNSSNPEAVALNSKIFPDAAPITKVNKNITKESVSNPKVA
jgi:hypothetical protein